MSYISFRNVVKVYPPDVKALQGVSFDIQKDEIHAIIGENGAGKSTIMKTFFALEHHDSGDIFFKKEKIYFRSPMDAVQAGVGMVHQEFMLIDSFSVWENIALGAESVKHPPFHTIDKNTIKTQIQQIADEFAIKIDVNAKIRDISIALQQKVEILKLLYRQSDVLIFDEPTAVLTPQETRELFVNLKILKKRGKTIIFISHKLGEVLTLSDTITVMRKGKHITTIKNENLTDKILAQYMVGRDVLFTTHKEQVHFGETIFEMKNVSSAFSETTIKNINLHVRAGEIVGIAGIEGSGQYEMIMNAVGEYPVDTGTIRLNGNDITHSSIRKRRSLLSYISMDRKRAGSAQEVSILENTMMTHHYLNEGIQKGNFLRYKAAKNLSERIVQKYGVAMHGIEKPISSLSGGNQQKLILGREFEIDSNFVILDQPTRGVDISAIEDIRTIILQRQRTGCSFLLVSADLDELMALSDRIYAFYKGKIVAEIPIEQATKELLGEKMLGVHI